AREIGELCRTHACTIYVTTPTFLRFSLRKCDEKDFQTIKVLICGAEKLPPPVADDFAARFGVTPLEGYGCTELAPAAPTNLPDDVVDGFVQVNNRPGTIGPPIAGVAIRAVDPDTLAPLPVGATGLIVVTGANVMQGYLGRPDLTARVLRDGWYLTGDMGFLD